MSHDYVCDLFGKFRKNKVTRFTDVETEARKLMKLMREGQISHQEFYERFCKVRADFVKLTNNCIDQDTPLWLNEFCAFAFHRWTQWHILRTSHSLNPANFNTPELEARYRKIEAMDIDQLLIDNIKYYLDNLEEGQ